MAISLKNPSSISKDYDLDATRNEGKNPVATGQTVAPNDEEQKIKDQLEESKVGIISDSLLTGLIKCPTIRGILESRFDQVRIYSGGTIESIWDDRKNWEIMTRKLYFCHLDPTILVINV